MFNATRRTSVLRFEFVSLLVREPAPWELRAACSSALGFANLKNASLALALSWYLIGSALCSVWICSSTTYIAQRIHPVAVGWLLPSARGLCGISSGKKKYARQAHFLPPTFWTRLSPGTALGSLKRSMRPLPMQHQFACPCSPSRRTNTLHRSTCTICPWSSSVGQPTLMRTKSSTRRSTLHRCRVLELCCTTRSDWRGHSPRSHPERYSSLLSARGAARWGQCTRGGKLMTTLLQMGPQ